MSSSALPGIAAMIVAGARPDAETEAMMLACDAEGVDVIELVVPFPDSPTDGPVLRAAASRALATGADLVSTLGLVRRTRARMRRTRVVVLLDWSHSIRGSALADVLDDIRSNGADGVLVHGLPPVLRDELGAGCARLGLGLVTTCYADVSEPSTIRRAAEEATAFVYLVSAWGRTGGRLTTEHTLTTALATLRQHTNLPIAVGFGVRSHADLLHLRACGADVAVVGTACLQATESAPADAAPEALSAFIRGLRGDVTAPAT